MKESQTRPYRKKKRARMEQETRRRIVEATVKLHGTVGPAATTISEVARLAGVSRMTVYNHFSTDVELFTACSTHWVQDNPLPDPSGWVWERPEERLQAALSQLYGWYDRKQAMVGPVMRDTPVVPALAEVMETLWSPWMEEIVTTLTSGWECLDPTALEAAVRIAADFGTWRALAEAGLDAERAATVMTRMVGGLT